MSIARCRCGKTKRFRGHRRHWTCPECRERRLREREATAVEIRCGGCGRTRMVPARQVRNCEPFDGFRCGMFGCKEDRNWEPPRPIEKTVGWHVEIGLELDGGFYSYRLARDTTEHIAATWRACEIRDAALGRLRGES
jgi:hypothetical protein